ncbi:MAG: STAS domain-containing protein [Deltaproteobacteria bacterium]|nr:STAS domain-containing protein [Deltaproteobacteria bacterium]
MRVDVNKEDGVLVLTPMEKSLDASVSGDFKQRLLEEIEGGGKQMVLDLSQVEFMDSSALGALVSALKAMGNVGDLAVCGVQNQVKDVFKLTRLDRVFRLFDNRGQACGALVDQKRQAPA